MSVPPGVPAVLSLSEVTRAFGFETTRTVRNWLDRGTLESTQKGPHGKRFVRAAYLACWAEERGFHLDWAAVLD